MERQWNKDQAFLNLIYSCSSEMCLVFSELVTKIYWSKKEETNLTLKLMLTGLSISLKPIYYLAWRPLLVMLNENLPPLFHFFCFSEEIFSKEENREFISLQLCMCSEEFLEQAWRPHISIRMAGVQSPNHCMVLVIWVTSFLA